MCGIAGMIDLSGRRPVAPGALRAMAQAIVHRGPDEDGFLEQPGVGLANRRLSIVGLADGRQPLFNEDRSVGVVYNGELFDYPEQKKALESRGHRFLTHCDTELLPHLWEDHGEAMFEKLRGQFAVALWDSKQQRLVLGRDRFGICPLYWTRQGDWLLFASEIKALLASGMVDARADLRGINHLFTFFALPGPVTCFEGVQLLPPGHFLRIQLGGPGQSAQITERTYWEIDFPDRGQEDPGADEKRLVDGFEEVMLGAVERRLRADVPVVAYLSGGVDSSTVVAMASKVRGSPIPTFTISVQDPKLNEQNEANIAARHIGTDPIIVPFGAGETLNTYPELVRAAEGPVVDTSCAALLLLAREVHARGYKVTLTGEGADEWLAGYPWYKVDRVLGSLDVFGLPLSQWLRRGFMKASGGPSFGWDYVKKVQDSIGGHSPWMDIYGLMSLSKLRFFSRATLDALSDHVPYADLAPNLDRMRKWHPFHRGLWLGIRSHLAGLLLNGKGDRVAMNSSVEARYPFLDEAVFDYLAPIHPRLKMRRLTEKYLLRRLAERWLPPEIAWRRKAMFRAPFDSFHDDNVPAFVEQLLSEEALRRTGYFDVEAVRTWRQRYKGLRAGSLKRVSIEMGLVGVLATQLWHQTFIDGGLADVPSEVRSQKSEVRRRTEVAAQLPS
jgi:asparagine synthase (glutamine-hydrolysing)